MKLPLKLITKYPEPGLSGEITKYTIVDANGDPVARIPRSWKRQPTPTEEAIGCVPVKKRDCGKARDIAQIIVNSVNELGSH